MLTLPWPHPDLNPNRRAHRMAKAKIAAAYKQACSVLAQNYLQPIVDMKHKARKLETCHILLTFNPPDARRRDLDNLHASMKSALDGVALAWGIDDRKFRPVTVDFGPVVKGGSVTIEIIDK